MTSARKQLKNKLQSEIKKARKSMQIICSVIRSEAKNVYESDNAKIEKLNLFKVCDTL